MDEGQHLLNIGVQTFVVFVVRLVQQQLFQLQHTRQSSSSGSQYISGAHLSATAYAAQSSMQR